MKRIAAFCLAIAGAILAATSHAADTYPVKPVRLIVPYVAGGNADIQARYIAERLTEALGKPSWICPVTTPRFDAAMPLYGTCTSLTPVISSKSAPAIWEGEPFPVEPKFSWPGRLFASAMSSFTLFAASVLLPTKSSGVSPTSVMG